MALFRGDIRSRVLEMDTQVYVVLPYDRPIESQQIPCPVVYLLHGIEENASAWTRFSGVERYARKRGLALIMPEVQRSFYLNMALGLPYFRYVTEELPELCAKMFGVSTSRSDTFVAGLSMGGFGALKCGLTYPDRYAGCASFSGLTSLSYMLEQYYTEDLAPQFQGAFGPDLSVQRGDDLADLAKKVSRLPPLEQPQILMTCGTEDYLYQPNLTLQRQLDSLSLHSFRYLEWEGTHDWKFWDKSVEIAFEQFFPL